MSFSCTLNISVIIPVHNGGDKFRKCLQSVTAGIPAPEEIIVVADGDTDGSWRFAEACGIKTVKLSTSGGPARARNQGAKAAQGDILFFVDADVTIRNDTVEKVLNAFQRDPEVVAVFGSYDSEPFEKNFLSQYKNLMHHYVHQTAHAEASTFWAGCGAIRREIFLSMDGFDETFRRPSIEDIELGDRLKKNGYKILLLKELQVKHLKRWEVRSLIETDFFNRAIPWSRLILKEGRFINDLNVKASNRTSVLLIYLVLASLIATLFNPWFLNITPLFMLVLLYLNRDLYSFFKEKRGVYFSLKTIFWHWLYFFYSGLAFAICLAHYFKNGKVLDDKQ